MPTELDDARESLSILLDTERFPLEEVGGSGELTLGNSMAWAEELARCREMIAGQRRPSRN